MYALIEWIKNPWPTFYDMWEHFLNMSATEACFVIIKSCMFLFVIAVGVYIISILIYNHNVDYRKRKRLR